MIYQPLPSTKYSQYSNKWSGFLKAEVIFPYRSDCYEFVLPDQIQEIAVAVLAHRLVMEPQARFSGRTATTVVAEILRATPMPG